MQRTLALTMLLFAAAAAALATPTDDVRNAETAFAKAFADRDQAKFFSYILDDAYFSGPKQTLNGKAEVIKQWSEFFKTPEPPFSWAPERVLVNAAGDLGLSTGPVRTPDGTIVSYFSSIWRKQKDGSWKVAFDGPGYRVCPPPAQAAALEEGFITTEDGAKLHYRKVGKGPAVIVPAGFIVFEDFKELADSFTLITYDMRNRGRSSRVEDLSKITIEYDLKDLEAVRRYFNLDRVSLVGYSYLGKMVALYAMDNPQRVERIVQLGPAEISVGANKAQQQAEDFGGAPQAALQKLNELQAAGAREQSPKEYCEAQAEVLKYRLVGDPSHASRVRSLCDLENEWPVNFARHAQAHFGSILALDVPKERVRALNVPVLTIHGTKDRNAPYAGGREWAATLPNARLLTVEGAAHQSWTDDPRVIGTIREFLKTGAWPAGAEKVTAN